MMNQLKTKQKVEETSQCPSHNTQHTRGISLISLIITIIVIIILAAIVIFTGLNTPDRANLAKFMQEISDFRLAVAQDFMNKKAEYTIAGKSRSDAQIYYIISQGGNPDIITDINKDATKENNYANIYTLAELGVSDTNIEGTYAYLIPNDKNVKEWNKNTKYYEPNERHYVTDKGDVFILKGYRSEEGGSERWYLNERTYLGNAVNSAERVEIESAIRQAAQSAGNDMADIAPIVNSDKGAGTISKQTFGGGQTITGVNITSGSNIVVGTNEGANSVTITVEPVVEGAAEGEKWYALIDGQYYKINDDLSIASQPTTPGGAGESTTIDCITVSTGNAGVATASATAASGVGTVVITGLAAGETPLNIVVNGNKTFNGAGTITAKALATVTAISNTTLTIDGAWLLTATVSAGDPADVIWESSNPEVATVTSEGVVKCGTKTTAEAGTVIISCKSAGATQTCTVTSTAKIATTRGDGAPTYIPSGFTAIDTAAAKWSDSSSNAEIGKGLVIMDEKGNEFVWVPVGNAIYDSSKDSSLPTSTSAGSLTEVEGVKAYTYTPMAINTNGTQNGTYDENGTYKGILYSYNSTAGAYLMYPNKTNKQGLPHYREPDTLPDYDGKGYLGDINNNTYSNQGKTVGDTGVTSYLSIIEGIINDEYNKNNAYSNISNFGSTMQADYNIMVQRVAENGGFYIGRYESSLINGTTRVLAGARSMKASEVTSPRWYGLYARQRNFAIENGHDNLNSHMIWGSQYDAMLNWMVNNSVDVTAIPDKNRSRVTGSSNTDKVNNVFDLVGNSYEWTAEANGPNSRVRRGGCASDTYSPCLRGSIYNSYGAYAPGGSRVSLY